MAFLCDSLSVSHGSRKEMRRRSGRSFYRIARHVRCHETSVGGIPPGPHAHVLLSLWGLLSFQLQCWSSCLGMSLPITLTLQTVKQTDLSWLDWFVAFIAADIVLGSQRRPCNSLNSLVHSGFPHCDTNVGLERLLNWMEQMLFSVNRQSYGSAFSQRLPVDVGLKWTCLQQVELLCWVFILTPFHVFKRHSRRLCMCVLTRISPQSQFLIVATIAFNTHIIKAIFIKL